MEWDSHSPPPSEGKSYLVLVGIFAAITIGVMITAKLLEKPPPDKDQSGFRLNTPEQNAQEVMDEWRRRGIIKDSDQ